MQKITADSILSDLVLKNPSLLPIVYLTGIGHGFDGKAIRQICKEKAINESYLLNLLKVYTNDKFVPTETLPSYSVLQLTELTYSIYPFYQNRFDAIVSEMMLPLKTLKRNHSKPDYRQLLAQNLRKCFDAYRALLSAIIELQKSTVIPHISNVYELYYSPDYTSERVDLMNYSLEFYEGKTLSFMHFFDDLKTLLEQSLELIQPDLRFAMKVHEFYQLNLDILAQERVVQKLLKPLVLQMEESIITTFHKKNNAFRRSNYLSMPAGSPPQDLLSPREKEVLQLVALGLMNKEIADQLKIGLTTVISHRKNIVEKLGIKTIPGLTVYAYTNGYLDDFHLTDESFSH